MALRDPRKYILFLGVMLLVSHSLFYGLGLLNFPSSSASKEIDLPKVLQAMIQVLTVENTTTTRESVRKCAPHEGVIILNTLGLLANNLFELGFANRIAEELCWPFIIRPAWAEELPNSRGKECLSNAGLPHDHRVLNLSQSLQDTLDLNPAKWRSFAPLTSEGPANEEYDKWVDKLQQQGLATTLKHMEFDFTGNNVDLLVDRTRNASSTIQLVNLHAFFIHYDWMKAAPWIDNVQEWLQMDDSCCHHTPPEDAVVIHVRDFTPGGAEAHLYTGIKPSVYTHIMEQYNLTRRPLWIVCQPKTVNSPYVKELVEAHKNNATIVMAGQDQYDAFCTLMRAKTLLLSMTSTYSQMAGVLAGPSTEVHYPVTRLDRPTVTISVPWWKYHLVEESSKESISEFDVEHERLTVDMA